MKGTFQPVAKIQTWGTAVGQKGIVSFLEKTLGNENIGHASIELQLAVTSENKSMVKKYCDPPAGIPYQEKIIGITADGTPQKIYVVRFSVIPSHSQKFELVKNYEEDCIYERLGANTASL